MGLEDKEEDYFLLVGGGGVVVAAVGGIVAAVKNDGHRNAVTARDRGILVGLTEIDNIG